MKTITGVIRTTPRPYQQHYRFGMSVTEVYEDLKGVEWVQTKWYNIVAYGSLREKVKCLKPGIYVTIFGQPRSREITLKRGGKQEIRDIILDQFHIGLIESHILKEMNKGYYLLVIVGDVEPMVFGPFKTSEQRDKFAASNAKYGSPYDSRFKLDLSTDCPIPHVETYSQSFIDKITNYEQDS